MITLRNSSNQNIPVISDITIVRSIENLISTCDIELTVASVADYDLSGLLEVFYDNTKVFTGYIFSDFQKLADGTRISFGLRSKPVNIARSMHLGQKTFKKVSLSSIITTICSPFGIKLSSIALDPQINSFSVNSTETAFEALDRLLKQQGLLLTDDADGNIRVFRDSVSGPRISLQVGKNVGESIIKTEMQDIHSEIIYMTETKKQGTRKAKATDANAIGYSPLVLKANSKADIATLQNLANFEVAVRAARARSVVISELPVTNWFIDGVIPDVNNVINFTNPFRPSTSGLYMVKLVELSYNAQSKGHTISLNLANPNEFLAKPEIKESETKKVGFLDVNYE